MATNVTAIGIENLRGFRRTPLLELRKLTLLLGANSSGKSTLLRLFPLLKQSVERPTSAPVLWPGPYVDFGDFKTARSSLADRGDEHAETIGMRFRFQDHIPRRRIRTGDPSAQFTLEAKLAATDDDSSRVASLTLEVADRSATFDVIPQRSRQSPTRPARRADIQDAPLKLVLRHLDGVPFVGTTLESPAFPGRFFPCHPDALDPYVYGYRARSGRWSGMQDPLHTELEALLHHRVKPATRRRVGDRLDFADRATLSDRIRSAATSEGLTSLREHAFTTERLDLIDASLATRNGARLISLADHLLHRTCVGVHYMAPYRAAPRRYTRHAELPDDQVDFVGENLSRVLATFDPHEMKSFNRWLARSIGITTSIENAGAYSEIQISEHDGKHRNLADVGFGYSQLLPILTQIWIARRSSERVRRYLDPETGLICIEQPEVHLHPRLQSSVGSVLAQLAHGEKDLRFVVETHSKPLVTAVGRAVAMEMLNPEDVQVVLFERDPRSGECNLRPMKFTKQGTIHEWPIGFLDA